MKTLKECEALFIDSHISYKCRGGDHTFQTKIGTADIDTEINEGYAYSSMTFEPSSVTYMVSGCCKACNHYMYKNIETSLSEIIKTIVALAQS